MLKAFPCETENRIFSLLRNSFTLLRSSRIAKKSPGMNLLPIRPPASAFARFSSSSSVYLDASGSKLTSYCVVEGVMMILPFSLPRYFSMSSGVLMSTSITSPLTRPFVPAVHATGVTAKLL
ncbi:MAG: hypothetical protein BWY89_01002 [Bacteroidetes bacterium ADurb.BinA012]|nr:MAG: hypothetical protein BWY89_01002 [Bacteroidetes bacterium ADurb.BinA012]